MPSLSSRSRQLAGHLVARVETCRFTLSCPLVLSKIHPYQFWSAPSVEVRRTRNQRTRDSASRCGAQSEEPDGWSESAPQAAALASRRSSRHAPACAESLRKSELIDHT